MFDKIAADNSYAAFYVADGDGIEKCDALYNCQVIIVPHIINQLEAGWIFPKRSALLSMFKVHVSAIKERGVAQRIETSWSSRLKEPLPKYALILMDNRLE